MGLEHLFPPQTQNVTSPGILTVKGYSSFDIIGGNSVLARFYRRKQLRSQKPPTLAEATRQYEDAITELHSICRWVNTRAFARSQKPDWEWPYMNSVSFTTIARFTDTLQRRSYGQEPYYTEPTGKSAIDHVEAQLRLRLYRDGPNVSWRTVGVSDRVPFEDNKNMIREVRTLIDRELIPWAQGGSLPGPKQLPVLTQ